MNDLISTENIYINSKNRTSGTISDFSMILPAHIFDIPKDHYIELELISFHAQQSYYNLSNTRNTHFILVHNGIEYDIYLDEGNYNVSQISTMIMEKLNEKTVDTGLIWTIFLNKSTLKNTYEYTGTGSVSFKNRLESFDILGFSNDQVNFTTNLLESTQLVSIGNINSFLLHSGFSSNSRVSENITIKSTILAELPVVGNHFFSSIIWENLQPKSPFLIKISSENITDIHFKITDVEGNLIEFSKNYNMTFQKKVYRKSKFNFEKLQQLIALSMLEKK